MFVISSCLGEGGFCFLALVFPLKRSRLIIVDLGEQIVRLIFFRPLLNDFFQHLDSLGALVCQNKTGGEFLSGIGVIGLQFQDAQIKRDRFFNLLRGGVIISNLLKYRRVVAGMLNCVFVHFVNPID